MCPVTATETGKGGVYPTTTPAAVSQSYIIPGKGGKSSITYTVSGEDHKTTTLSSTTTSYVTVEIVKSTATLVPIPYSASVSSVASQAPYPSGGEIKTLATGTAAPSLSLVVGKVSTTSGVAGYPTSSTTQFTGAAARSGVSVVGLLVGVVGGLVLLI